MSCYIVGDDRLSAIAISMSKWKEKSWGCYIAQHEDAHDRIDSIIHCGYKPLMDGILYGKEEDFI